MATADEIIIGSKGKIYVAPANTAAPNDALEVLDVAWVDVGVVTEDGVTFTDNRTITDIEQWGGFYPVRKITTARETTVSFALRQWNSENLKLALGGGDVTGGVYTPPAANEMAEHALIVQWQDGLSEFRLYIARGMVSSSVSFSLTKGGNAELPVEFSVLGSSEGDEDSPYLLLTDASGFDSETES